MRTGENWRSFNSSKIKVLTFLQKYNARFYTAKEVSTACELSYSYLRSRLPKWHEWGYVRRAVRIPGKGRPVFCYALGSKGEKFLDSISAWPKARARHSLYALGQPGSSL